MERKPEREEAWLALLLGVTLVVLVFGGLWVKGPCVGAEWDGTQYERRCYSDLIPLYVGRGMDESQMPYVEVFNEYPVLTGVWMVLASLPSEDSESYFMWNAIGLSLLAFAVTFVLWRTSGRSVHVLWWAAAPALALYAFHNWDLLAVLFMVLGLHAFLRDRFLTSGVFLGLGVAAKLFPIFLLPALAAELVRRAGETRNVEGDRPWWRRPWSGLKAREPWWFAGGVVGSWLVVNLPFILINRSLWWETYTFHSGRGPTAESHWNVLRFYAGRWGHDGLLNVIGPETLPTLSFVMIALGVLALAVAVLFKRVPVLAACLGSLCVFLLANQVISVQYMLWIVPLFVLVPGVAWGYKVFVLAADVFVYWAVFGYFHSISQGLSLVGFEQLALASMVRVVAVALLLVAVVRATERGVDARPDGFQGSRL